MTFLTREGRSSINIDLVDEQHKGLVELINTLHDFIEVGEVYDTSVILELLAFYAVTQLKSEEELFLEYGYPEYLQHKEEHNDFTRYVLVAKNSLKSGKPVENAEILSFLMNWLFKHILITDKRDSSFLNRKASNSSFISTASSIAAA